MDFNKLNTMMDELTKNFDIIEDNTNKMMEDALRRDKEYFYSVHDYFVNWASLFEKVRIETHPEKIFIYTNAEHMYWIEMVIGQYYRHAVYGDGFLPNASLMPTYNKRWFDKDYFTTANFRGEVLPTMKSIDYDYVEKQLMEKLNEWITKKAESIERKYNEAREA